MASTSSMILAEFLLGHFSRDDQTPSLFVKASTIDLTDTLLTYTLYIPCQDYDRSVAERASPRQSL